MTSEDAFKEWYKNGRRDRYKTIEELSQHAWEASLEWKGKEVANEWEVRLNDVVPDTECEQGYTSTWSDTTGEKALLDAIDDFLDHQEWGRHYKPGDAIRIMYVTDGLGNTTRCEEIFTLKREHFPIDHPGLTVKPGSGD